MSGSSFDWADDVIEEAETQQRASESSEDETTIESIPDVEYIFSISPNAFSILSEEEESTETDTSEDLSNVSDNEADVDAGDNTPCSSPEIEAQQPSYWSAVEASAQGKFDQWAEEALSSVKRGWTAYHVLFLPQHLAGWYGEEVPSLPKPKDTHRTVVDPTKMLAKMPYLELSYMGCLTFDSISHKEQQQRAMKALSIEEKEVPLTEGEKLRTADPKMSRWICRPSGMRNSWKIV